MKKNKISCSYVGAFLLVAVCCGGCTTGQNRNYYTSTSYPTPYSQSANYSSRTSRGLYTTAYQEAARPANEIACPRATGDGAAVSDEFKRRREALQRKQRENAVLERERMIDEFLSKNPMLGVSEVRDDYRNHIALGRSRLGMLAKSIRAAGSNPQMDSRYQAVAAEIARNVTELKCLDDKIMNAHVNRLTGDAARVAILTPEQRARADAARTNLDSYNR